MNVIKEQTTFVNFVFKIHQILYSPCEVSAIHTHTKTEIYKTAYSPGTKTSSFIGMNYLLHSAASLIQLSVPENI
mgnify:CR=1 FL=1